jgi:DNA repair protein RadA/Sms
MNKSKSIYVCVECRYESPKWQGKCPECSHWNSFQCEDVPRAKRKSELIDEKNECRPKPISEIEFKDLKKFLTNLKEFDRVMGDGITKGSITLIGGEPGIGKSTLLMEICGRLSEINPEKKILYISGEETEFQVAERARRLEINSRNFYILNENNWEKILLEIKKSQPDFLVLDSIQTTQSSQVDSGPGSMSQIREITLALTNFAKSQNLTCFIIGHVTKDGQIAGPKILEHMVDTVVYFEGDQFAQNRILRSIKNRFGKTNEVGLFEMRDNKLQEVTNISQLFIEGDLLNSFGRSITTVNEGSRSLFVEVQALVVENKFAVGRRITQGIESNRISLLVAVVDKYFSIPLSFNDIFVNVAGGLKLSSRDTDLAVLVSLLSSYFSKVVSSEYVFLGEIGLTGEVRSVPNIDSRLREISQLKYKKVLTSKKTADEYQGKYSIKIEGINKATDILDILFN